MKRAFSISFLFTILIVLYTNAQGDGFGNAITTAEKRFITEQLNQKYWVSESRAYNAVIPEEYTNASAVILDQTIRKEYYRNSRNYLRTINLEHKIILLMDKEAVRKYSVFSYEHISGNLAFDVTAVKIIKPDGRESIIDLDSITVSRSYDKVEYRKFVIPGLEVGDILDYYYYLEFRVLFPQQYSRIFDPVYWLPQGEFPILNLHFEVVVGPSAFLNASANKLPSFDQISYKIDRKTFSKFSISRQNLDPINLGQTWFYPFRELPNLRYQVFISPYSGNTDIIYNLGGSLKLNTDVQHSRIQDFMEYSIAPGRMHKDHYSGFVRYLKFTGHRRKKMEKTELAAAYYGYEQARRNLAELQGRPVRQDVYQFISRANYVFAKLHIDRDVVIAFDRSLTDIDQFILTDEIVPMMRLVSPDTLLLASPSLNEMPGEVPPKLESSRAFAFDPSTLRLNRAVINPSEPGDNMLNLNAIFELDKTGSAEVLFNVRASGHEKLPWKLKYYNTASPFLKDSTTQSKFLAYRYRKDRNYGSAVKRLEEKANARELEIEAGIYDQLPVSGESVSNMEWEMTAPGNEMDAGDLTFRITYTSDELAMKGNRSFLVPLKEFTEGMEIANGITEERKEDLYLDYPRIRELTVLLAQLPNYEIGELEGLDSEVVNSSGSFFSSAELGAEGAVIRCRLELDKIFVPAEASSEIADILNAFYDFTEGKVLYRRLDK